MSGNLDKAKAYVELFNDRTAVAEQFLPFWHEDIQFRELPNLIAPHGSNRNREVMATGIAQGAQILTRQQYTILNALESGNTVVLEVDWEGDLAIPFGAVPAGVTLRAHIAMFLEFVDGRIIRQRNYDCYEPLPVREKA
ncbi:MAG: nuclear transport factor 2 family protein [Anaerolineae bacterium]|nr:nuclear transport factor 2 family protein [Anaerolineae bacterium]